jgi:gas vesicle protein
MTMSRNHKATTIVSFILGAGVGAVAALLFAPKAGEELRGDIANGVSDGISEVRAKGKDLKQKTQKLVELAKDQVHEVIEAGENAYTHAKKAF